MLSNSGWPLATPLQPCTCASGLCSYRCISRPRCWRSANHATSGASCRGAARSGSVLMNSPTIDSIPDSATDRPDTVTPTTTSSTPA